MARTRLELPEVFPFSCEIPVRITDLNYGGHVGNDTILSLIHESRMQFISSLGYNSELQIEGVGLIMTEVTIEYKSELFYQEKINASVGLRDLTKIGFDLYYKLEKTATGNKTVVALARTSMLCFDYGRKKVVSIPEQFMNKLSG